MTIDDAIAGSALCLLATWMGRAGHLAGWPALALAGVLLLALAWCRCRQSRGEGVAA